MTGVSPTKRGPEDNGIPMEDKGGRTEDKNGLKGDKSGLANGTELSSKKVQFTIAQFIRRILFHIL
jgi:hypothetical protein